MKHLARGSKQRGHTLLEMTLSLVLLAMIAASVGSAVMFAAQVTPGEDSPSATLSEDARVIARIAEDISLAKYILEQSETAITIVLSSRSGDGNPDRVRYAWSGKPGDPLTFELNGSEPEILIQAVEVFSLGYTNTAEVSTLPGALAKGDSEIELSASTLTSGSSYYLNQTMALGQRFTPSLSDDAVAYQLSRIALYGSSQTTTGTVQIGITDVEDDAPADQPYATATLGYDKATDAQAWHTSSFESSELLLSGEEKFISITPDIRDGKSIAFNYQSVLGTPYSFSSNAGESWGVGPGGSLVHKLYGYEIQALPGWDVSRVHTRTTTVTLQSVSDGRSPIQRTVRMLLNPPKLEAFSETGFDADPTGMDLDADGEKDWIHSAGSFPLESLSQGLWVSEGRLINTSKALLTSEVISVNARMRSNDTLGPTIFGPHITDERGQQLQLVTQLRSDGAEGQELVIYNDTAMATEHHVVGDLPAGLIDIGLTLLPEEGYLYIEVNHQPKAAVHLDRVAGVAGDRPSIEIGSSGGVSEFGSVVIRLGGTYQQGRQEADDLLEELVEAISK